jgi:putative sugar O-methyltransferase
MIQRGPGETFAESLARTIRSAAASAPYQAYLATRETVLCMKDEEAGEPSAYWREELRNVRYMLHASPLVIASLRHHCYHLTGVWPYTYRSHKDRVRDRHAWKLARLLEVGPRDLLVHESSALGGFGFELEGGLVNLDTLKYFECLIALDRADALLPFRDGGSPVLLEIGAGWGGFAYQFKTIFPHTTYVIVDLPELFLYAVPYLTATFPDARIVLAVGDEPIDWSADFVLVPAYALDRVGPPRADLAVNTVSFQEMTTEQVRRYARHVRALGSPLYSLNREHGAYNEELSGVSAILREDFRLREVDVLPIPYTQLSPPKKRRPRVLARRGSNEYRHLVAEPKR